MRQYEVFKSDEQDITYTRNFYNFEDHSISMLKSIDPIS